MTPTEPAAVPPAGARPGGGADEYPTGGDTVGAHTTGDTVDPRISHDTVDPRTTGDTVDPRISHDTVDPRTTQDTVNPRTSQDTVGPRTTGDPVGTHPPRGVGIDPVEYSPWEFAAKARPSTRETQRLLQEELTARPETHLGTGVFVSSLASVDCEALSLGDRTYVAAGAYITGTISLGRDCSVNPYTVIRGDVRIGDATRIGAHTSLLGFNHTMADPTVEFFRQPLVSRGIQIGDDVWIGSHVVVLDGVRVGSRSVLAAGAVVTKDVPDGAIVGGNPARFLKWRIAPEGESDSAETAGSSGADPAASSPSSGTDPAAASPSGDPRLRETSPSGGVGAPETSPSDSADTPETSPSDGADTPETSPSNNADLAETSKSGGVEARRHADFAAAVASDGSAASVSGALGTARTEHVAAEAVGDGTLRVRLAAFANRARAEARDVLDRAWDGKRYVDRPGTAPTVRAWCDAIEIADLLLGDVPPQSDRDALVQRLRGWQDAATGAVPPLDAAGVPLPASWSDEDAAYHVLAVGYALDLLGSSFPHELRLASDLTPDRVPALVEGLPWQLNAWGAGAWIDAYGTALVWERTVPAGTSDALFGALARIADPVSGVWGSARDSDGLLQPVNGFYRASRGTFAQHGRPLPYPTAVVDTVLTHVTDERFFAAGRLNACNVLDVAHPLWLTRSTGHRASEVAAIARQLLDAALGMWQDGAGIPFAESPAAGVSAPGLQGTEMWLSIVWYLADLLGASDALGYRPRGVHRPEPRP
ncbi:DapH/DapD/GlmU-related protein [Microbacterium sp. GXS0129]|uniref:DapH/DapD/GlmU-related protein n=1 Tax=Microbacterium sp. GXS0129 TaxID=3377836 RepID=UPI00383B001D